jgi:hypothetical protein
MSIVEYLMEMNQLIGEISSISSTACTSPVTSLQVVPSSRRIHSEGDKLLLNSPILTPPIPVFDRRFQAPQNMPVFCCARLFA